MVYMNSANIDVTGIIEAEGDGEFAGTGTVAGRSVFVTNNVNNPIWRELNDGELAIGHATAAPQAATLTPGTGIDIVNAPGAITINATELGDVVGPAVATGSAAVRFDNTTGKLIKNSGVIIDNSNAITGVTSLTVDNINLNANTISTSTSGMTLAPSGATTVTFLSTTLRQEESVAGGEVGVSIKNDDTTVSVTSVAEITLICEEEPDSEVRYASRLVGDTGYAIGLNKVRANSHVITTTNNQPPDFDGTLLAQLTPAGQITHPLQPSFLVHNSSNLAIQTGNGAIALVAWNVEDFDQGGDFNIATETFTAPVAGKYNLDTSIQFSNATSVNDTTLVDIETSIDDFRFQIGDIGPTISGTGVGSIGVSGFAEMDAADTAVVRVEMDGGGANDVGIQGSNLNLITFFSGNLET